ncbi:RNA-directed DNA polymerase from mobile element jockey-like, partial [Brachionus plicatilis]
MNKFNYFKILHLNCQSIISDSKKIQLSNLINETNCDVLSLNETFLKKQHNLYFEGYVTLRSDRTEKKGGGTALCIKKSINGTHIKIDNIPETVGYKIKLKNGNELALFSHYSSPSSELNEKLFEYAANNFKFFLIVGDFNALNTSWFSPTTNKKVEKLGLFILNNETPTYKRSKNILDLIICSKNMQENIEKFDVLSHSISDHCPIAATLEKQSESKHWKALLNINREENSSQKDINIKADHHFTNDPAEIAELFACNLEKIFTENHPTTRNNSLPVPNLNKIHISRKEMIKSIKTTNSRASAGLDLISNK